MPLEKLNKDTKIEGVLCIMIEEIRKELFLLSEKEYKKFSASLIPNTTNMLGIRIPKLRELAKRIANEDYVLFLKEVRDESFEETMLHGMVIGYAKMNLAERLNYLDLFLPKINNWSVCDSCCMTYKFIQKNLEIMWEYIQKYLYSKEEFYIRFALVVLLDYYMLPEYIEQIFMILNEIRLDDYYAQMAAAWTISVSYVKFPEKTKIFLQENQLNDFTYNKSIQKICESNRVHKEDKVNLKAMKR